ncbi:MAG: hypothetical protein LUG99_21510 [Lachnospiraceae bacterium]|nr:hypothetical protein [Lachnospiraceae bacterium]
MSKRTLTAISDLMEDLFNGKIYPAEQITSKSPRCREVEKEITAAMTDLENTLDKETYAKIEHVHLFEQHQRGCPDTGR